MVTYPDEQGEAQWYPVLIVEYRPRARMYHFVVHFEQDGVDVSRFWSAFRTNQ
jgi:hypothetical protein